MFQLVIERGGYDFRSIPVSNDSNFRGEEWRILGRTTHNTLFRLREMSSRTKTKMTSFEWFIMGMMRRMRIIEIIRQEAGVTGTLDPYFLSSEEYKLTKNELSAVQEVLRLGPKAYEITNWEFLELYGDLMKVKINYRDEIRREMQAINTEHLAVARLCNAHMNKDVFRSITKYLSYPNSARAEAEVMESDTSQSLVW